MAKQLLFEETVTIPVSDLDTMLDEHMELQGLYGATFEGRTERLLGPLWGNPADEAYLREERTINCMIDYIHGQWRIGRAKEIAAKYPGPRTERLRDSIVTYFMDVTAQYFSPENLQGTIDSLAFLPTERPVEDQKAFILDMRAADLAEVCNMAAPFYAVHK